MKFLLFLGILIMICLFVFIKYSIKFRNPFKLYMCFGKKGAGKSTYMVKLTYEYLKKGWTVFATNEIPGAYKIEPEDIGFVHFPEYSVVLVDEVGMIWDNRNFKAFKPEVRDFFKLQRHYRTCCYLFSQSWDVDLKLRMLTDKLYLMINYGNCLTVCKEIKRKITVVKPSENAESRIADELVISPFFMAPFGARHYIWIPKWYKYFDSFAAPPLPQKDFRLIEYPEGRSPFKKLRKRKKHGSNRNNSTRSRNNTRSRGSHRLDPDRNQRREARQRPRPRPR